MNNKKELKSTTFSFDKWKKKLTLNSIQLIKMRLFVNKHTHADIVENVTVVKVALKRNIR